jgi:hypothetical protein
MDSSNEHYTVTLRVRISDELISRWYHEVYGANSVEESTKHPDIDSLIEEVLSGELCDFTLDVDVVGVGADKGGDVLRGELRNMF